MRKGFGGVHGVLQGNVKKCWMIEKSAMHHLETDFKHAFNV